MAHELMREYFDMSTVGCCYYQMLIQMWRKNFLVLYCKLMKFTYAWCFACFIKWFFLSLTLWLIFIRYYFLLLSYLSNSNNINAVYAKVKALDANFLFDFNLSVQIKRFIASNLKKNVWIYIWIRDYRILQVVAISLHSTSYSFFYCVES